MTTAGRARPVPRRWVALLRGINLGSRRRVPMARLRELAEDLGYTDVATHLNSGNLLLTSEAVEPVLAAQLAAALQESFGFAVDVVVRSGAELGEVLAANPYPHGDPKQVQVVFLAGPVAAGAADRMTELATSAEQFQLAPRHVYVDFAGGLARSKLAVGLGRALGVPGTSRNLRTVAALAERVGAGERAR